MTDDGKGMEIFVRSRGVVEWSETRMTVSKAKRRLVSEYHVKGLLTGQG
jgi:hypothetical protein